MRSDSLDIKCNINGVEIDCSKSLISGTKLIQSCKTKNSLPNRQLERPNEIICLPDGNWSGQLLNCAPSNNFCIIN